MNVRASSLRPASKLLVAVLLSGIACSGPAVAPARWTAGFCDRMAVFFGSSQRAYERLLDEGDAGLPEARRHEAFEAWVDTLRRAAGRLRDSMAELGTPGIDAHNLVAGLVEEKLGAAERKIRDASDALRRYSSGDAPFREAIGQAGGSASEAVEEVTELLYLVPSIDGISEPYRSAEQCDVDGFPDPSPHASDI